MASLKTLRPDIETACKYCKTDLDDGDVYEKIKSIFYLIYNHDEILRMARHHGWTHTNRLRFTKEVLVYKNGDSYSICPECKGYDPLKK